jgi:hypothetical protein
VLLDVLLPEYDVWKRHAIRISAPRQRVFEALGRYDFGRSLVTRALMTLRGYGRRRRRAREGTAGSLVDRLDRFGFTLLSEKPGEELVFGLAGRFWRYDGGLRKISAADFPAFCEPGFAKAAWNLLCADTADPGVTELSTETRVACYGETARRRFLRYWRVVEPFSGLIRRSLLRGVRRAAEGG